jgi:hypothetical protein
VTMKIDSNAMGSAAATGARLRARIARAGHRA